MSLEIKLINSLLASVIGSGAVADSLIQLFREKFDNKSTDVSTFSGTAVSDRQRLYLTGEKEAEIATDAALEALDEIYQSKDSIASERMRQARVAFNTAISLMIVGVVITFFGVTLLWLKDTFESGAISVAVGAVSEILSLIVFGFNKETNNRLDDLRKDLSALDAARIGLSIAKEIEDQGKRDDAIAELSLRLQRG